MEDTLSSMCFMGKGARRTRVCAESVEMSFIMRTITTAEEEGIAFSQILQNSAMHL